MSNKKITYDIGFNVDNSQLSQLRQSLATLEKDFGLTDIQLIKKQTVEQAKADLQEVKSAARLAGEALTASFNPKINSINIQTFQNYLKQSNMTVQQLGTSLSKAGLQGEQAFRNMSMQILNTGFELKKTNSFIQSMAQTLGNTIKWSIASTAINTVTGSIQKAWGYTQKLDTSLNDIRIVTEKSAESMEKFAKQANKAAKALGSATTDYTNASLIYYQQGLGDEDVAARTDVTLKAANVTGQSAAEVSEQLTAVWNGYKVVAEEAELYVDKLAAVAAKTAADLEELSTGMSKVASAANAMGVDIDQLSAQLSTIVSVTRQDASVVGTALKTIYSRMGDLEVSGVDEFGTSLGDVSGKLKQMGIDVLDQEGNLRDMGAVIEEVAAKWGTWTDAQQQAAAVAIAGKRQYNNLIALFENWDMYESALTTSQASAGTLQKQQDIYMESLEAHLQQLSTAGEKLYDTFFNSDSMKDLIDVLTAVVDQFASLTNAIGGGGNLLLSFGSIAVRVFSNQIGSAITGFISNIQAARFNVNQLQAQMALLSQLGEAQLPKTQAAYNRLLEMKKEELRYQKAITAEQKQQADAIIEQANNIETTKEDQKVQLDQSKASLKTITGKDVEIVGMGAEHLQGDTELEAKYQGKIDAERALKQTTTELGTYDIDALREQRDITQKVVSSAREAADRHGRVLSGDKGEALSDEQYALETELFEDANKGLIKGEEELAQLDEKIKKYEELKRLQQEQNDLLDKANQSYEQSVEASGKEVLTEEQAVTKFQERKDQIRTQNLSVSSTLNTLDGYQIEQNNLSVAERGVEAAKVAAQEGLGVENLNDISEEQKAGFSEEQIQLLEKYQEKTKELEAVQKKVEESSKTLQKEIETLNDVTSEGSKILTEDQKTELLTIQTNEKYAQVLNKVAKGEKLTGQEQKVLQEYFKKSQKVFSDAETATEKAAQELTELGQAARATAAQAEVTNQAWNKLSKQMQIQAITTQMVDMVGAIGQISSALSALTNLGDIWSDESLSGGEKFLQTLTALGTMIPMLISGMGALKNGYLGVGAALLGNNSALAANMTFLKAKTDEDKKAALVAFLQAKGVEEGEEALKKKSLADLMAMASSKGLKTSTLSTIPAFISQGVAAWASLGPYAIIIAIVIAAIAVLIGLIAGLTAAFKANGDNGKKAFDEAAKAAEAAAEEFNRVKAAYDELKKSFEDYNAAQKAIEEMTVGTEEWRQAIQDANMQVIELMNKYPELAQYVDNVDGQLKISAAGQEAMLEAEAERVDIASRANMAAQINKLNAKNNMDIKTGANDTLQTDTYQNVGAVAGIVGIGLGALGPAGVIAGALGATASYLEAEARENAYEKAVELASEDETLLASEEAFAKAMADAGFSEYTDALWAERDALLENSSMLAANNAAIKIQQEEIARSYLAETDEYENLESEDQDTLAKIVAKETGSDSQAYKNAVSQLGGDDVDDKEAEAFADKYASLMGIDAVETKVKDGVITYVDANGEEIKVNAKTAQTALAQEMAGANVTDVYVEQKIEQINAIKEAAANGMNSLVRESGDLLSKFAAGESADLASGTEGQIKELQAAVDEYEKAFNSVETETDKNGYQTNLEEQMEAGGNAFAQALGYANEEELEKAAQEMGYDSLEEYKDAIQKSIDNYKKEEAKLTLGLDADVSSAFNKLKSSGELDGFSLEVQKVIAQGMKNAFEQGGAEGLDAFNKMLASGDFTSSEIEKISNIMSGIDWSASGAANELAAALEEAGIEVNKSSDYWDALITSMDNATNVVQDVINNLDTLRSTLASVAEITDDLKLGDIVSDEDYDTLVANNAELKKYFVMTADGYKYLGGAEKEFEKAKNNILDVDEIKSNFDEAKAAGDALLEVGDEFLKQDEKTGKITVRAGKQDELTNALKTGKYNDLLNATGYSAEQYQNKIGELQATSTLVKTKSGGGLKLTDIASATNNTDLANKLGFTGDNPIQEFADAYFGGDFNAANTALSNALTDANTRVSDAEDYISNAETAVVNSLNQMQSGDWDQMSRDAQTAAVSGLAKNYDELKQYKDKLFNEDYNKLALTYLAEEAAQLGINADVWESYVQSVGENLDLQEQYLNNIQALQVYDSADAYHYIEQAITDATEELDKLADAQNRAFGKDVLSIIDEQIEKIKELADETDGLYKKRYDAKQKEIKATEASFVADQAYLENVGLSSVNLNDGISETEYNVIFEKAQSTTDSTENAALVEILNKIIDYNNLKEDAETEYQDAIEESNQQVLDLQIEKYNQEIEMNREFRNTVKEWRNSMRDFKRFSEENIRVLGKLSAFEELSASATLSNIMEELDEQGMAAASPESFAEITQLEQWRNGGGINNPFVNNGVFDANQFNEAYTAALETAQEDVQGFIDLGQELFDTWLSSLEEISTMYDEQVKKLSTINSLLESSANLNKLLGNSSKAYYSQMRQNAEQTVELYAAQVSQLEQQYNNFFDADGKLKDGVSQEQADAIWDAYTAAKQNHVDAIQAQYDAIVAEFETSIQEVVDNLFGGSLDNISEAWNLEKSADEMYFDDVNAEYEKYKFERAVQKSIDTTDSITAQNKLKNVLQEQLAILEKKNKLSQYDIDRANAMYELTLKQIALEEAQQTANKMKLTRDASGNYTYQYVADEDKIAQAQEELAAAENELYNLQKDHQSELIDTLISGVQEYQELTVKYMNDPEMPQKVQDHYAAFFGNLKNDMSDLGMDVGELTEMFGSDMSTPWMETFDNLAAIDTESLLESTANLFSGEDGITAALTKVQDNFAAYLEAEKGMSERLSGYVTSVDDLNTAAGAVADKMADANSAMDTLVTNIGTLVDKLDSYVSTYTQYLGDITGNEEQKIAETTSENKDDDNEGLETAVVGTTAAVKESNVLLQVINDNLLKIPTFTPASGNFYPYPTAPEIVPTASSNSFATVAGFGVTNKTIGVGNSYTLPVIKP